LIVWFVPIINRFPRIHKFTLGDRIQNQIYEILEQLILTKYEKGKLARLEQINGNLEILQYQIKLLIDFKLIDGKKFYSPSKLINEIGAELGDWIKQQK
jgi:bifunctional ADP-heptose synthase (sugar kinase/adenylyltransferase)